MIYIKIPKDRIGALIGPKGAIRKQLEKRSGFKIDVDTEENEVTIHDEVEGANPLDLLKLQDIIKAVGRGFSPDRADRLWSDEAYFELLDIYDFVGKHKNHVRRIASRIIGAEGKTRRIIQEQTGCDLSIYGHTVGIIGNLEALADAKHACEMLLRGAEHASVYRYLERKRRDMKRADNDLWM